MNWNNSKCFQEKQLSGACYFPSNAVFCSNHVSRITPLPPWGTDSWVSWSHLLMKTLLSYQSFIYIYISLKAASLSLHIVLFFYLFRAKIQLLTTPMLNKGKGMEIKTIFSIWYKCKFVILKCFWHCFCMREVGLLKACCWLQSIFVVWPFRFCNSQGSSFIACINRRSKLCQFYAIFTQCVNHYFKAIWTLCISYVFSILMLLFGS